jgi:hypothetical protein
LPELKRVIVSFSNRLVMEENLDIALARVLGEEMPERMAAPTAPPVQETSDLGSKALQHYNRAREYLKEGSWAEYGRELEELEKILEQMAGKRKNTGDNTQ